MHINFKKVPKKFNKGIVSIIAITDGLKSHGMERLISPKTKYFTIFKVTMNKSSLSKYVPNYRV